MWIVTESPNKQIRKREDPGVERRPRRVEISRGQLVTRSASPLASRGDVVVVWLVVSDSATPWTGAHQALLSVRRTLEWVALACSRGSSRPSGQTRVSCIGRQVLYH